MLKVKSVYRAIISFFFVVSFVISSTTAFAEIVGRLSVHWSPKHHSAKHAQIFADEVNKRANGKLKIDCWNREKNNNILPRNVCKYSGNKFWFNCDFCSRRAFKC